MKVAIVGAGYVGLVTSALLASLQHVVTCIEYNPKRLRALLAGKVPFHEPGLDELVADGIYDGNLHFSGVMDPVQDADVVYLAVGTPTAPDGSTDLTFVEQAAQSLARHLRGGTTVVVKSTVPVGTGDMVEAILDAHARSSARYDVVSNPEFLREGTAIQDALNPDRIVIGSKTRRGAMTVMQLLMQIDSEVVVTDRRSAELIKYAANSFLATRISFANTMAQLCDEMGADVEAVMRGAGLDRRVGTAFFRAGLGYGGSCFPKDVTSLIHEGKRAGVSMEILEAVVSVNDELPRIYIDRLKASLGDLRGQTVAVLGLAFKADTDDVRESRGILLVRELLREGAVVRCYDPEAMEQAHLELTNCQVFYGGSAMATCQAADAVVVATDWPEFRKLDYESVHNHMRGNLLLDGRNYLDRDAITAAGLLYFGLGRNILRGPNLVSEKMVA